ncbi:MAG: hypothetical protein ACJA16_004440 [Akkermansiaceae bacterium]
MASASRGASFGKTGDERGSGSLMVMDLIPESSQLGLSLVRRLRMRGETLGGGRCSILWVGVGVGWGMFFCYLASR